MNRALWWVEGLSMAMGAGLLLALAWHTGHGAAYIGVLLFASGWWSRRFNQQPRYVFPWF